MENDLTGDRKIEELDFRKAAELNKQRRIYRRRPKTARNLINDIIARRGIAAEKSNNQLQGIWDAVVGMDIANQTRVGSIRRGVLEVVVTNSSLMQLLGFNKHEYKEKINQQMQFAELKAEIKDLRFRIGSIS